MTTNSDRFLSLLNEIDFVSRVLTSSCELQEDELIGELLNSLDEVARNLEEILERFATTGLEGDL